MKRIVLSFVTGLIVMALGGYFWMHSTADPLAPKDEPEGDIHRGPLETTETIAVGEVVNGIRQLNRLIVFQAYVTANTTTHNIGWFSQTDQTMITPAFVNYYIDLNTIDAKSVRINGKDVYVSRPPIMIERPNIDTRQVQVFNNGVWSALTSVTDALRIKNNKMALRQLVARAKMPFLVQGARAGAEAAEEVNIRRVLAQAGHTDVRIHIASKPAQLTRMP